MSTTTHRSRVRVRSVIAAGAAIVTIGAGAGLSGPARAANAGRAAGAPIVIGMVDTGVNANHQEFTYNPSIAGPNGQFVAWWDFSADAARHQPLSGQLWDTTEPHPFDPDGHGTNTTSMAAGKNVTVGKTKSFAPGYKLSIAKVADKSGSISGDLASAIRWQVDTAHADIISMSIGELAPLPAGVSQLVFDSFAYARQRGVLVVVANGNGFANAGGPGEPGWATGFGDSTNVLAVGAQDPIYTYLVTTDCEVTAQFTVTGASNTSNTGTVTESGTSFATPLTAGFAARLMNAALSAGQNASPDQIEKLVKYSAIDNPTIPPNFEGYGTIRTIPASASTTPQLDAALANASAGTLPNRPSPDVSGLYVETVGGTLRDAWTNKLSLSGPLTAIPTGIPASSGQGAIGASTPVGLAEGEVYHLTLAPGQSATLHMGYVLDPALGAAQDVDLYAFSGTGPTFNGSDLVSRSANTAGVDESVSVSSSSGGTYSIVVLGWAVARNQRFTITATQPLSFASEGYYLQTFGGA